MAELAVALELALRAGDEVVRIRNAGALGVELKAGDEPVTIADRLASELIVAGLAAAFPGDPIISEELPAAAGAFGSERFWLVDPIDGTKDFIRGTDGFSIMIGLVEHGRPSIGVVYQPTLQRMFFASPDGAFVRTPDATQPLHVSTVAHAGDARLVSSASHRSPKLDEVKTTLGIADEQAVGSVGVKLALIALGVRDLYVNPWPKTKAWDTCAPEAILVRAGGRLTDVFGAPVAYAGEGASAMRHPRGLVGSNGLIHDEVVGRIAPLFDALRTGA